MATPTPYLINIVGPTAIGKTALAIKVAQHFNTEIISADSRQFYKELSIGTAKPTEEELSQAPHHFIGNLSIHDEYNAGKFEKDAIALLDELFKKHSAIVMVGGSGMFTKAVIEGFDELPEKDQQLRDELQVELDNKGIGSLQERLKNLDAKYYEQVDINNPHRLMRAIEVCTNGEQYSDLRTDNKKQRPFKVITIGLNMDRELLYKRINARVDLMMNSGLLKEVHSVYEHKHLNSLNTVGYKELFDFIDGKCTLDEATDKIKQNTRRFAKRQLTWFRRDADTKWFEPTDAEAIINYIETNIK